jgi:Omp85 superfamily domain
MLRATAAVSARPAPLWLMFAALGAALPAAAQQTPGDAGAQIPTVPVPVEPVPVEAQKGWSKYFNPKTWFNPATAPFIPIPEIAVDPDSGTTLGLIPTWLKTDENNQVRQIIAPDILHNPFFGWGVHGRIYSYSSGDEQWSVVAGIKERVERKVDAEWQKGRLRDSRWSINTSLLFDRDGTPRFYGIGNRTRDDAESNFTSEREFAQTQVGFNITHAWQILYTARFQTLNVLPGTLSAEPSTDKSFPTVYGLHTHKQFLNRVSIVYDTRDDLTIPTKGMKWSLYGGAASSHGLINDSMYSEAGIDGRLFFPVGADTVLAEHVSLRYLPTVGQVPFWALSTLGGGESEIGGLQPLRGYGAGRFYDRNAFSASVELRHKIYSLDIVSTKLDIEVAPFVDLGRVFADTNTSPISHLHQVYGVGFRGIARPFVVGYVDIGLGSDGAAVFTGLNYPF